MVPEVPEAGAMLLHRHLDAGPPVVCRARTRPCAVNCSHAGAQSLVRAGAPAVPLQLSDRCFQKLDSIFAGGHLSIFLQPADAGRLAVLGEPPLPAVPLTVQRGLCAWGQVLRFP